MTEIFSFGHPVCVCETEETKGRVNVDRMLLGPSLDLELLLFIHGFEKKLLHFQRWRQCQSSWNSWRNKMCHVWKAVTLNFCLQSQKYLRICQTYHTSSYCHHNNDNNRCQIHQHFKTSFFSYESVFESFSVLFVCVCTCKTNWYCQESYS